MVTPPKSSSEREAANVDDDRAPADKNRRFGASLRKLYRQTLDEPLSPELKETLERLDSKS